MSKKRKAISDQIRDAITSAGVSRYEICKQTGINQATLSRFMNETGGMSVQTLDKLGKYLGLEITAVNREDRKPKGGKS